MSLIDVKDIVIKGPLLHISSFIVNPGDIIHLQGGSGVGKSTFLKALVSLKKVSSGKIYYDNTLEKSAADIRESILYIPQFSGSETINVSDHINEVFSINKSCSDITDGLQQLGISDILNKRVDQISGGERQLLNLLIAMNLDRDILICDESFSAIDPQKLAIITKMLLIWSKNEKAIVFVSHQKIELEASVIKRYLLEKTQDVVTLRPN